ncbi:MAG: hypothetical protein ACLR78_02320 [Roseburia sp.]
MEGTNATREEVAQQLREVRKSQGMTQELLADRVERRNQIFPD